MKAYLFLVLSFMAFASYSQEIKPQLHFEILFNGQPLDLNKNYYNHTHKDSIKVSVLKFYISDLIVGFKLKNKASQHVSIQQLVNIDDPQSMIVRDISLGIEHIKTISFTLGLDSTINVSGALGGDLDPTQGMYWSWQSGYINFKLEGTSGNCTNRNKDFQFHLGGYQYPFDAHTGVELTPKGKETGAIQLDLYEFFNKTNLSKENGIMSPSKAALSKSQILSKSFSLH